MKIKVRKAGQITIPKPIRQALQIREGQALAAEIEDGALILWINSVMEKLGASGNFDWTRKYVNDLRERLQADWGFVIFVVDSFNRIHEEWGTGWLFKRPRDG